MKHDFFADEEKIDKYEKENGLGFYAEPETKPTKKENTEIEEPAEETEEQAEEQTEKTEEQAEEPAGKTESEDKE